MIRGMQMKYIYTILSGNNTYSVFERKSIIDKKVIKTFGICIENKTDTVYVPDITTVREIALCIIKIISADKVMPDRLHNVLSKII